MTDGTDAFRGRVCRHAVIVGVAGPGGSTIDKCGDCGLLWDWRTKDVVAASRDGTPLPSWWKRLASILFWRPR